MEFRVHFPVKSEHQLGVLPLRLQRPNAPWVVLARALPPRGPPTRKGSTVDIAEQCDRCGAERPSWMGGKHVCHADFLRSEHKSCLGKVRRVQTFEPHTAAEYEELYLKTGRVGHDFLQPLT